MRYDSEHKERTRQRVLREAAVAIRSVGPDRIGVAGLMAKAGLTHGGFYAHFKSKDELIAQAVAQMFEDSYERFKVGTQGVDPATGLGHVIDSYLSVRHRDNPDRGCPMPSLSGELARMPAAARQQFTTGAERLMETLAQVIKQLGRAQPEPLAESVVAELVGAVALSRAITDRARSERILENSRQAIRARLGLETAKLG
jgi:TetR/AcrR family transcriptional repressor of nem operon